MSYMISAASRRRLANGTTTGRRSRLHHIPRLAALAGAAAAALNQLLSQHGEDLTARPMAWRSHGALPISRGQRGCWTRRLRKSICRPMAPRRAAPPASVSAGIRHTSSRSLLAARRVVQRLAVSSCLVQRLGPSPSFLCLRKRVPVGSVEDSRQPACWTLLLFHVPWTTTAPWRAL